MNDLASKLLFTVACLTLPVLWGVLVNWLFNLYGNRASHESREEPVFPDYQI